MADRDPLLSWTGAVPVSTRFDDPYYSLDDGLSESRHVFFDGNDLPARLRPGFTVAELGVGTGLNLLILAQIAQVPVRYIGFEAFPMSQSEITQALAPWPALTPEAEALLAQWPGPNLQVGLVQATLILGDARQTLSAWDGLADAWFLDGFSPAKNPELWDPDLLIAVGHHTQPGGTFATYTAAGHVRRALETAGFQVERCPGFGRKRHMTRGSKR